MYQDRDPSIIYPSVGRKSRQLDFGIIRWGGLQLDRGNNRFFKVKGFLENM
jgi:hypothetical protein